MTTTLDTLVATAGMGFQRFPYLMPDGDGEKTLWCPSGVRPHISNAIDFQPSTNIAHAHMFRDKVLAEHREWRVVSVASQSHIRDEAKWFYVDIKDVTGRFISESGTHSTEHVALCLALLRALGVPEEKIKEAMDGKA